MQWRACACSTQTFSLLEHTPDTCAPPFAAGAYITACWLCENPEIPERVDARPPSFKEMPPDIDPVYPRFLALDSPIYENGFGAP